MQIVNTIANNILILKELCNKLSTTGALIVTGAIGSERVNSIHCKLDEKFANIR